jgi:hypothetical protein
MDGKKLEGAAAAAGMSERSARTRPEDVLTSATRTPRDWRTRPAPFAEVWDAEVVPLLEADEKGVLRGSTLLELCRSVTRADSWRASGGCFRRERRVDRLRRASRLPPGKTFAALEEARLPRPLVQRLHDLARGDFLERAGNLSAFGLPGVGKSHAACALGHALVEAGHAVLIAR